MAIGSLKAVTLLNPLIFANKSRDKKINILDRSIDLVYSAKALKGDNDDEEKVDILTHS